MLNVYAGDGDGILEHRIGMLFKGYMEDEWFEDKFVKELIKEIDKSDVISPHLIESPVLGAIPPTELSGGVKCLIMLYKVPEIPQLGTLMGENCLNALMHVGSKVNCSVYFDNMLNFNELTTDVHAYFPQIDKYANSSHEFLVCLVEAKDGWRLQNKDKFEKVDI